MEVQTPVSLEPGPEKELFVLITLPERDHFHGILTETDIQPAVVAGTWFPTLYQRNPGVGEQIVVLYLHGGAFATGGGRTANSGFVANTLILNLKTSVLSICYRLSCKPKLPVSCGASRHRICISLSIEPGHPG